MRYKLANEIQKLKLEEFIDRFEKLLLDEKTHNILIRGYFDDDKLLLTFECLKDLKNFYEGVLVIGNTTVPYEEEFLRKGLHTTSIGKLNLSDSFNINGLSIKFLQWKRNKDFAFGFNMDFAIFHPVESVLHNKDFSKFCATLNNSKAKKNILITTNDFNDIPEKLYPYIDEILILDTTDLNKKHQQTYKVIQDNLNTKHRTLPY